MRIRRWLVVGAALSGLAVLVLLTPRNEDPDSTLALRRYLANLGHEVVERDGLPSANGTMVLLQDIRTPDEVEPILDWVDGGGQLVVADPDSEIVRMVGGSAAATLGWTGVQELEPSCVAPAVVGVERIVARATDRILVADDPALVTCFPVDGGGLLLTRGLGQGTVTLLGGSSAFTNALLPEAGNAVLAAGVAGAGSEVVLGPPTTTVGAPTGIWDALPDGARAALIAIIVATVAFALVRARRLGGPPLEAPITPIPGSELVRAAARLYRRARVPAYAGNLMRHAALSRLSRRLGVVDSQEVATAVVRASGMPRDRVEEILLGRQPRDDSELMALGADLETLSTQAEMRTR